MQTIWRKVGQSIQIGDSIKVTVDLIRRGRVRVVVDSDLCKMLGNGVPIPMGRAIAKAVREAIATP